MITNDEFEKFIGYRIIGNNKKRLNKFLNENYTLIHADASYKNKITLGTSCTRIETLTREYKTKEHSFRAQGPVHAEMLSIYYALKDVQILKGITNNLLVLNDNEYALLLSSGSYKAKKTHIKKTAEKIKDLISKIPFSVEFGWVRSKLNKKVDKIAKKILKNKEKQLYQKVKERYHKIIKRIEESRNLEFEILSSNKVRVKSQSSERWYIVTFNDIPSCTCEYWMKKWGNKEKVVILTQALPCKHMCRAADVLGIQIIELFRKQIFRNVDPEKLKSI